MDIRFVNIAVLFQKKQFLMIKLIYEQMLNVDSIYQIFASNKDRLIHHADVYNRYKLINSIKMADCELIGDKNAFVKYIRTLLWKAESSRERCMNLTGALTLFAVLRPSVSCEIKILMCPNKVYR